MTILSVNLNKIALLRNSRGRDFPNITTMAERAIKSGAKGITIHPRPDQRHAKYDDIKQLKDLCDNYSVELNIEGYPTEKLITECIKNSVHQVTLVPDLPNQITSDHGWIVSESVEYLSPILKKLKQNNIRTCLFMDTQLSEIKLASQLGVNRIELHTESYARSFDKGCHKKNITDFIKAFNCASKLNLKVNAGHDLDLRNLSFFLANIAVAEVSIGHSLTIEALDFGWEETINKYVKICNLRNLT